MASLIFNSLMRDVLTGAVDLDTDSFKMMLVTSAYTPDKDTHTKRSNVTNEVVGTGYTAGGAAVTATVAAVDTANDRVDVTFSNPTWPTSTITARAGVIYKSRGGASSADELICYVDFGADVTSTADTFTVTLGGPLRLAN
jgi:hypothetical protein